MDRSRTASDKVRPFLQAMERNIEQVRAKRIGHTSGPPSSTPVTHGMATPTAAPAVSAPVAPVSHPTPGHAPGHAPGSTPSYAEQSHAPIPEHDPSVILEDDEPKPARLKARPKRTTSFGSDNPPQSNFSQAG